MLEQTVHVKAVRLSIIFRLLIVRATAKLECMHVFMQAIPATGRTRAPVVPREQQRRASHNAATIFPDHVQCLLNTPETDAEEYPPTDPKCKLPGKAG